MKLLLVILGALAASVLIFGCLPTQPSSVQEVSKPSAPFIDSVVTGDAEITVTWGAISNAVSYNLYYSEGTSVTTSGTKKSNITSPYVLTGLTNGTKYALAITAMNAGGESVLSNVLILTPLPPLPNAPVIDTAIAGVGTITVSWEAVLSATSYTIYYDNGYGSQKVVGATSPYVLRNLENGMQYTITVCAVNIAGESKLNESRKATPVSINGTVTDIDGNLYHYITIGSQVWLVENLRTTRYNNGDSIPFVSQNANWAAITTPGYCLVLNDTLHTQHCGLYYNWYAVNTGKVAPSGWHVPTDAEWSILITYLGGASMAGGKLKSTGMSSDSYLWEVPNTEATNASGFTALPGGSRDSVGKFNAIGLFGEWWSATTVDATHASANGLVYNSGGVFPCIANKRFGFSVRCIKD